MTPNQRKFFYIPKWLAVAKPFDWVMVGGRLLADLDEQYEGAARFNRVACELVREIITRSRALAAREQRAVTADDLRHALNQVASRGRTDSATKLTNLEFNEFDRIHVLLREPFKEDLNDVKVYVNKVEDDRQRAIRHLNKLSYEAQLRAISDNAFHTKEWESLPLERLNWMIQTVKDTKSNQRFPRREALPFLIRELHD